MVIEPTYTARRRFALANSFEKAVLVCLYEHPTQFRADILASYAGLTLEEFSSTYRKLTKMGQIKGSSHMKGLAKAPRAPIAAKPKTVEMFPDCVTEKQRKPTKRQARTDLGEGVLPK